MSRHVVLSVREEGLCLRACKIRVVSSAFSNRLREREREYFLSLLPHLEIH